MKKLLTFLSLFLFGFVSFTHAETIKMGYFLLRPHMYESDGNAKGAAILYFEKVAKKMGYSVKWQGPLPFVRLVKYLKEGKLDGAQMFSKNSKRTSYLYYPEKPYFTVRSIFVLRKDHKTDKISSIDDVAGFRVGYLKGANLSKFVKENYDKFQMEFISGTDWVAQNIQKVLLNRLDAAYDINHVTVRYEAEKLGVSDQLKFIPLPEEPMYIYTVFSKKGPNGKKFLDQYNAIFDQLSFSYDEILEKQLESLHD